MKKESPRTLWSPIAHAFAGLLTGPLSSLVTLTTRSVCGKLDPSKFGLYDLMNEVFPRSSNKDTVPKNKEMMLLFVISITN